MTEQQTADLQAALSDLASAAGRAAALLAASLDGREDSPEVRIRAALAEASGTWPAADDPLPTQLAAVMAHYRLNLATLMNWIHDKPTPDFTAQAFVFWARRYGFISDAA
jgi:hypothetical protein